MILGTSNTAAAHVRLIPEKCQPHRVLCSIRHHHRRVNVLRARMSERPIPYHWQAERYPRRRARILAYWHRVHVLTLRRYRSWEAAPWLHGSWYAAAMCVHHYEGSWTDPGAPYWGGLQMDLSFQAAYGAGDLERYGTADHWPVADQLHAAYRAWRSRGWTPWPSTARMCHLL